MPCSPGQVCNATGLANPVGEVEGGYFARVYAAFARPAYGSKTHVTCSEANWEDCDYGPCPAGYQCPQGTGEPVLCSEGTFSSNTTSVTCQTCPGRRRCPGIEGQTAYALPCFAGSYCPAGTGVLPPKCPPGRYGPYMNHSSADDCVGCDPGRSCSKRGLAEPDGTVLAGYYSPGNASTVFGAGIAPPGTYAQRGAALPVPCPNGTFSPNAGSTNLTGCENCTSGSYCSCLGGCAQPTGPCLGGYYCLTGSTSPTQHLCPRGYQCPLNSSLPALCAAGRYANVVGTATCRLCPAGFVCEEGTTDPVVVPPGYYAPNGTKSLYQAPCPEGTYLSTSGNDELADCQDAPPGTYALGVGNVDVEHCDAGYFCANRSTSPTPTEPNEGGSCGPGDSCPRGSSSRAACPGGSYCVDGTGVTGLIRAGYYARRHSYTPTPDNLRDDSGVLIGDEAPAGYYAPEGSARPIPCPAGRFSISIGNTNLSDCEFCLGGYICPSNATAELETLSPAGSYAPSGTVDDPLPCPEGSYCPEGSAEPIPCDSGTYQNRTGQSSCRQCPASYFCLQETIDPFICPKGFYCPAGTTFPTQFHCGRGTFSNRTGLSSQSDCQLCRPGTYCETTGLAEPTGLCDAGFHCFQGSTTATPRNDTLFLQYAS